VPRVWRRAAVAIVAATAATCVSVPAAQAWPTTMQIAFQANTGDLWTFTASDPGSATPYGLMAGTNPSVAPVAGLGSNHEIAFQANRPSVDNRSRWPGCYSLWDDGRDQPEHQ
jgi:hypothetical protein